MKTQDAIEHFGGVKELAHALRMWPNNIYKWGENPPIPQQYMIYVKSGLTLLPEDMADEENNKQGDQSL